MQENSFYIPCCSYSWKSKHFVKKHYFQVILLLLDENYYQSSITSFYIYYTFGFLIWY